MDSVKSEEEKKRRRVSSDSDLDQGEGDLDRDPRALPLLSPSSTISDGGSDKEGSDWTICLPSDSEIKDKSINESQGQGQGQPQVEPTAAASSTPILPCPSSSATPTQNYQRIQQGIASTVNHFMRNSQPRKQTVFSIVANRLNSEEMKKITHKRKRVTMLEPYSSSDSSGHSYSGSACSRIVLGENSEFSARIKQREGLYGDLADLWKSKEFSDIIFQCDSGELKAHKLIVSARSEVFRAMFSSGMSETTSNIVKIDDIKLDTMKILVEYMYTGCVLPLTIEELSDLLRAADKYQMNKLKNACFQLLIGKLKVSNAGELVMLAHLHNADDRFKFKIQEYVIRMRGELWKVPEFKEMVAANPMVFCTNIFETYQSS